MASTSAVGSTGTTAYSLTFARYYAQPRLMLAVTIYGIGIVHSIMTMISDDECRCRLVILSYYYACLMLTFHVQSGMEDSVCI